MVLSYHPVGNTCRADTIHAVDCTHNHASAVVASECQSFILHVHVTDSSTGMPGCSQKLSSSKGRLKRSLNVVASTLPLLIQWSPSGHGGNVLHLLDQKRFSSMGRNQ